MIKIGFIFGMAIYGIIWFLTLFMVLPWGVVSPQGSTINKVKNQIMPYIAKPNMKPISIILPPRRRQSLPRPLASCPNDATILAAPQG